MTVPPQKNINDPGHVTVHEQIRGELIEAETHQANNGIHVPSGGTTGQALVKTSNSSGATAWADQTGGSGVPSGGSTGQVLAKLSNTSGDVGWQAEGSGHTHATHSVAHSLDDLADVSTTGADNGELLKYNAGSWSPSGLALADMSDVVSTAPTDGQSLVWDGAGSSWRPETVSGGGGGGGNLVAPDNNVPPASPATGQFWLDRTHGALKEWDGTAWQIRAAIGTRFAGYGTPTGWSITNETYPKYSRTYSVTPLADLFGTYTGITRTTGSTFALASATSTPQRVYPDWLRIVFKVTALPTSGQVLRIDCGLFLSPTTTSQYLEIDSTGSAKIRNYANVIAYTFPNSVVAGGAYSAFSMFLDNNNSANFTQFTNTTDSIPANVWNGNNLIDLSTDPNVYGFQFSFSGTGSLNITFVSAGM